MSVYGEDQEGPIVQGGASPKIFQKYAGTVEWKRARGVRKSPRNVNAASGSCGNQMKPGSRTELYYVGVRFPGGRHATSTGGGGELLPRGQVPPAHVHPLPAAASL